MKNVIDAILRRLTRLEKRPVSTSSGQSGATTFLGLTDTPSSYSGQAGKFTKVNAGATGLEFATLAGGGDLLSSNNLSDVANAATARTNLGLSTTANQTDSTDKRFMTDAQEAKLDAITGTNTGDQTSIVGITGTKAQFDTAVTDGNFMYIGDPPTSHSHVISDVTNLQTTLDGKASTSHTHVISDVTNLQTTLDGKAATSHTHSISDVTGLQTSLDGKALSSHSHVIGDVTGLQTALDGKALTSHTHAAGDITSGTIDTARLGSGTANSSSYLRGDQTWSTISGGGDVVGDDTSTTAQNIVAYSGTGGKNITELTGTQGDILYHNGTSWQKLAAGTVGQYLITNGSGANPAWSYGAVIHYSKSSGATTTGANTTPVSVSGAVFNYVANAVYRIWVMGRLNSAAATTGAAIHFDLSSAVTAIDVNFFHQLAAGTSGTLTGGHSIADDTSAGTSSGVPTGPLDVPITGFGLLVTGANTGTCQLRLRSETTAVTELLAGTVMVVERVG